MQYNNIMTLVIMILYRFFLKYILHIIKHQFIVAKFLGFFLKKKLKSYINIRFHLKRIFDGVKKIAGTFKVMSLQEPPLTEIFSRSKNGCVVVQKSVIFYHVSQYDTLLDIMCESGYSDYGNECGERGINIPFRIPITYIKTGKYFKHQCLYVSTLCFVTILFQLDLLYIHGW